MINSKGLDNLTRQIDALVPQNLKKATGTLQERIKQSVVNRLSKMDMVSREEFDRQARILQKTRQKVEELEDTIEELEEDLKEAQAQ